MNVKSFPTLLVKSGLFLVGGSALIYANIHFTLPRYTKAPVVCPAVVNTMHSKVLCSGKIAYKNASEIKSEIYSTVLRKEVKEAQRVKKGDLLVALDASAQRIGFENTKRRGEDLAKSVKNAKSDYELQQSLFDKKAIPRMNVEKAKEQWDKALVDQNLFKEEFAQEKKRFEKVNVRADRDGVVLVDYLQANAKVKDNDVLFLIGTPGQYQLNGEVDELNIGNLAVGAQADVFVDAYKDISMSGIVTQIKPVSRTGSFSMVGVEVEITDNKNLSLATNLSARALILGNMQKQAIWIPIEAILADGNDRFAFVVDAKNRARKRSVQTGLITQTHVEIASGLKEGENIVVSDCKFLRDGERIGVVKKP